MELSLPKHFCAGTRVLAALLAIVASASRFSASGAETASPASTSSHEYQVYPLAHASADEAEKLLTTTLSQVGEPSHVVADTKANQVLVQGSPRAQQLARQLLSTLDKSPAAPAESGEESVLRKYTVPDVQASRQQLRAVYSDESRVRLATDPNTGQLIVVASPELQKRIAEILTRGRAEGSSLQSPGQSAAVRRAASPAADKLASRKTETTAQPEPPVELTVRLAHTRVPSLESSLLKTLGSRLEPLPAAKNSPITSYRLQNAGVAAAELSFDERGNAVVVKGPGELARQLTRLVQAMDTTDDTRDRTTRIIPFRTADPRKVKQALDAYMGQGVPESTDASDEDAKAIPAKGSSSQSALPSGQKRTAHPSNGIGLVGYIFEAAPADGGPAAAEPAGLPDGRSEENTQKEQLRALGIDVDVETLPDLDIVILRGRDRDVEELSRIIDELERLSAESEPEIVVVPLRHVRGSALTGIITQISPTLVGPRQGRVLVTSLEKPNSLLLIGWGEALQTIRKLIRKLDQPVSPESQLQVFVLENARPEQLAAILTQFFAARQGLGTQVNVVPDPRSDSLIVHASPRDMEEIGLLIKKLDTEPAKVNQAKIFKLSNAMSDDVAQTLRTAITAAGRGPDARRSGILEFLAVDGESRRLIRSGLLTSVEITSNPRNNTLLVIAPPESLDLLEALISQLDTGIATAQIKVFRVVNADANNMVAMLRSIFPADSGAVQGPALSGAEGETSLVPLRFSVDTRSNSIIATGSEGDLRIIEALLLRLDERGLNDRQNQVFRLKNAPALDVANAINEFLRSERIVKQAAPGVSSPFEQIEREVVVVPEPISNSLLLSSTPRFFDEIKQLITKLDEEPAQVMIQVLIAEVQLDNAHEFGVEMGLQDSVLFDRSLLGDLQTTTNTQQFSTPAGILTATNEIIQAATNTPGYNFNGTNPVLPNSASERSLATSANVAPQALSNFALGRMSNELGFGGLVLSASSESVSMLLRALQENRRAEILSRPQVRTLDNQPAFIQIGERVPRVIQSTITTGGTITNSIDLENVGMILGVTPRISPAGMVVMEIDAEKSELGREAEGVPIAISASGGTIRAPIVRTTVAEATVSALDGETIILGGLITKSTSTLQRKVPYLAEIPLVGQLFRYDSETGVKKELLIILTPHIIRNSEDSDRITQLETARISWCCADVHAIHGVAGLCNVTDCPACAAEIPALYPDFDPRGIRPNMSPNQTEPDAPQFEQVPAQPTPVPPQRQPVPPQPIPPQPIPPQAAAPVPAAPPASPGMLAPQPAASGSAATGNAATPDARWLNPAP